MAALADRYPYLPARMKETGSIEIGYTNSGYEHSFLRVIQYTDLVWSNDRTYASLDDAFAAMEEAFARWCKEQGITLGKV